MNAGVFSFRNNGLAKRLRTTGYSPPGQARDTFGRSWNCMEGSRLANFADLSNIETAMTGKNQSDLETQNVLTAPNALKTAVP